MLSRFEGLPKDQRLLDLRQRFGAQPRGHRKNFLCAGKAHRIRFHEPGRTEQGRPIERSTTGFQHRDALLSLTVSASQESVWKAAI
jgi:hypothetical protein